MTTTTTGLETGVYAGSILAQLAVLLARIPNPDAAHGSGAIQGGTGYLDEMSPGASAQLRAELAAIQTGLLAGATDVAYGEHTITAGEAAANQVDIVTGLADLTLSHCAVSVWNGATLATVDAIISEPVAGTIRVADGTTYNTVAGYVIRWIARP